MTNCEDPDQSVPSGTVCFGSALFFKVFLTDKLCCVQNFKSFNVFNLTSLYAINMECLTKYSKICLKRPLKNRQNKGLNGKW